MRRFAKRSDTEHLADEPPDRGADRQTGTAPTVSAVLDDGPLEGRTVDSEVVEGRPPKTIDVDAPDGSTCRYCLAQWEQAGGSATYTFLYLV